MSYLTRIRAWRTRRSERKAEDAVALSPKDTAEADYVKLTGPLGQGEERWTKHAGEEGRKHY